MTPKHMTPAQVRRICRKLYGDLSDRALSENLASDMGLSRSTVGGWLSGRITIKRQAENHAKLLLKDRAA